MNCVGRLTQIFADYSRRKYLVTLEIDDDIRQEYDRLKDKDKLRIEIKEHKEKRSLDANAYFHVLVGKISEAIQSSKPAVKNSLLAKYGQVAIENDSLVHLIIRDDIDVSEREDIHLSPTSAVKELDDGKLYRVYRLIRGSHTYNTAEMSYLIDGTVSEANALGIETMTPDQIREMKERWGVKVGKET